jgi:hypothetical protein
MSSHLNRKRVVTASFKHLLCLVDNDKKLLSLVTIFKNLFSISEKRSGRCKRDLEMFKRKAGPLLRSETRPQRRAVARSDTPLRPFAGAEFEVK